MGWGNVFQKVETPLTPRDGEALEKLKEVQCRKTVYWVG